MKSFQIRPAKKGDFPKYAQMLQKSISKAYTNKKLGLPSSLFSEKIFSTKGFKAWMKGNLYPGPKKKTWVALSGSRLIGAVTIKQEKRLNELRGFYIDPKFQGKGLGKQLLKLSLGYSKGRDIILILYSHNLKSLAIYKKWGFIKHGKPGSHHWPLWPKGVRMKYTHLLLSRKKLEKLYNRL